MAGIYLHIPFCKVKCHYCDFHFSTQTNGIPQMTNALIQEIELRKDYLGSDEVTTIYFGGGTPSLIPVADIQGLLQKIGSTFNVASTVEVTLECNPDDLNKVKLKELKDAGVNRLSIGIQSFNDDVLKFMNRAHSGKEAISSIENAQESGFDNITIDLIYGIPDTDQNYWKEQLDQFLQFNLQHLSAYNLTIEENTVFGNWTKKGKIHPLQDQDTINQFTYLMDLMQERSFDHYEISNFCKEGFISQHNSSYWKSTPYLGIGPSAHSFNQKSRTWNISHNLKYIRSLQENKPFSEEEVLSEQDQFNEYLLTRLRTKWGVNLNELVSQNYKIDESIVKEYLESGHLTIENNIIRLTRAGKYIADRITSDLFV